MLKKGKKIWMDYSILRWDLRFKICPRTSPATFLQCFTKTDHNGA